MRKLLLALLLFSGSAAFSQETKKASIDFTKPQIVEAACGECKFNLKGNDCDLAVRFDGRAYFVDGTSIDDHGDAHAKDGFCNNVRKAEVTGKIEKGRFKATLFKLVKEEKPVVKTKS